MKKLKTKLWAVFMTALFLFSLPLTTAFAIQGDNEGGSADGGSVLEATPFGKISTLDNFAWRVNLYVSANPDGKINKASDRVGSDQLPLVGSVLCTSSNFDFTDGSKTYLQTNYTDTTRDKFNSDGYTTSESGANIQQTRYALPTLMNFTTKDTWYTDASGNTVVVNHNNIKILRDMWRLPVNFTKANAQLNDEEQSKDFVAQLFENLKGESSFWNNLGKINPQVINRMWELALSEFTEEQINALFPVYDKYLLPTDFDKNGVDDCLVEWAFVITPMYRFLAQPGVDFPYYDSEGNLRNDHAESPERGIVLDAFWMSQANQTSIKSKGAYYKNSASTSAGGTTTVWQPEGVLRHWLMRSNFGVAAASAYCSTLLPQGDGTGKQVDQYLGVHTHYLGYTQDLWGDETWTSARYYAGHGGIAVYTTEISDPEKPIYYHIYTYTLDEDSPPDGYNPDTNYPQEGLLQFIDKLPDPKVEVQTSKQSINNIASKSNYYVPATDTEAKALGIPVAAMSPHPSITPQPGKCEEYPTYNKPDAYLQKYPGGVGASEPTTVNSLGANDKLVVKKGVKPTVTLDPKEFHVKIVNVVIKEKTPPVGPSTGTDRIKSQDVTQFIEIKPQANEYIDAFKNYAKTDPDNYNDQGLFTTNRNSTHNQNEGVWITSIYQPADKNDELHDASAILTPPSQKPHTFNCNATDKTEHPGYEYSEDPITRALTTSCTEHHHDDCNWNCPVDQAKCHWTTETVEVYYGIKRPEVVQRSKVNPGATTVDLTNGNTWKAKWINKNISESREDVGVVVPESYYSYKDVVKAANKFDNKNAPSAYKNLVYVLPEKKDPRYHNIPANPYAVFDVLMKDSENYWIQYKNVDKVVGKDVQQYTKFEEDDIKADWTNPVGDGKFDWMSSGTPIDAVNFIAHRDLLSADDVSTSLAVSGYMAKYADKSHTYGYLDFMRKAGFTFRGVSNLNQINDPKDAKKLTFDSDAENINHENRVVWVANAADVTDLKGSKTGIKANEYNTNFVGGKYNRESPNARQKCHFGLGGLADDGADIFARIEDGDHLKNGTLDVSKAKVGDAKKGDVLRTTYYVANRLNEGATNTPCYDKYIHAGANHIKTGCCSSQHYHRCEYANVTVDHDDKHKETLKQCENVPDRHFIAIPKADIFIDDMRKGTTHTAADIKGGSQDGAISKIEASRIAFEIALGVEGTTAGQYDGVNSESGLKYDPTDANGEIVDNYQLTIDSSDNTLILKHNSDNDETKSWKENTFEICHANYQSVGEAKKVNKANRTFAEYHFTTPTRDLLFNPSYYMLYDDDFSDANKSVWMLSEQKRKVNFKDILSVRLTQSGGDDSGTPANEVYPTHVSSEWSTDLADTKCHNETKLPVAKAGNAIKATTEKSGGTVTMYVVLQDPDFTANPNATKNANNAIMADYQKQAQNILKQFKDAASSNGAAMTAKGAQTDALSMAMYSNVTNLSSLNSGYRVEDIATGGQALLNDKEPLRFTKDTKLDFKVTTGDKGTSNAGLDNWSFFAMPGYEVKHLGGNSAQDRNTDISDTTTAKLRKLYINSSTYEINNLDDASAWQKNTINELNNRLCMLMVPQDKRDSATLNYPKNTTPYLEPNTGDFNWYAEDYEGFIVGVYEIEFEISGKANSEFSGNSNNAIETEFSTIYRSESDWRTDINKLATKDGHDLTVYTSKSYQRLNINNFMSSNMNTKVNGQKSRDQVQLSETNGEMRIVTEAGVKTLKNWAKIPKKNLSNHAFAEDSKGAAGVYGIGLELANLNVSFGSDDASKDRNVDVIGGNNGEPFSFYYQPTYFHIRGSVYDTAR